MNDWPVAPKHSLAQSSPEIFVLPCTVPLCVPVSLILWQTENHAQYMTASSEHPTWMHHCYPKRELRYSCVPYKNTNGFLQGHKLKWGLQNPALQRQGWIVLWLKWDPVVPGKLSKEEPWKKVEIKPFCLCLHLVCLFRFIFLFLSSHESCVNASSSNVRNWCQTLHSSKAWKGSKPSVPLMVFEAQNKWLGHLLCSKWPAANQTTHLNQFPLGACGGQFHTQWVLHPTQWKSYFHTHFEAWLLCTKQCKIRSFFSLVFPGNQPAGPWKKLYSEPICQFMVRFKRHETDFLFIPVYPYVPVMSHVHFYLIWSRVNLRETAVFHSAPCLTLALNETVLTGTSLQMSLASKKEKNS